MTSKGRSLPRAHHSSRIVWYSDPSFTTTLAPFMTAPASMMPFVLRLAGLMHDLGKVNRQFQVNKFAPSTNKKGGLTAEGKIKGRGEYWRHELLSVLLMCHVILDHDDDNVGSDKEALIRLKDWSRWEKIDFQENRELKFLRAMHNMEEAPALHFARKLCVQQHPVWSALSWMVISHHRLPTQPPPRKNDSAANAEPLFQTMFGNLVNPSVTRNGETWLAKGEPPWRNLAWRQEVQDAVDGLLNVLASSKSAGIEIAQSWALWSTHMLRPLLIGADHMAASAPLERTPATKWEAAIHANSRSDDELGDTLTTHLRRVGRLGDALWTLVNDPKAPVANIPVNSTLRTTKNLDPRFVWQRHAEYVLRPATSNDIRPTFVAVIAETGSGKTLGGARILAALNTPLDQATPPTLRATFAFGMRSITLQTGQELFDANLNPSDVAVLIGNPASRVIFEEAQEKRGTESATAETSFEIVTDDVSGRLPMAWVAEHLDGMDQTLPGLSMAQKKGRTKPMETPLSAFFQENGKKLGTLLAHPIVVCTVDHIIHGVEAERSTESLHALRAMTADLVLDELDAYSAKDLVSLNKLVMLHGMAGRHVIIMSATLSPVVATAMFDAWNDGLSVRRTLLGDERQPRSAVVFNNTPFIDVPPSESINDLATSGRFKRQWENTVKALMKSLKLSDQRRHFQEIILPEPAPGEGWEPVWKSLAGSAMTLHDRNHNLVTVDVPRDDGSIERATVRVSAGFVRFNTARKAAVFARWALTSDLQALNNMRVLSYHSKYPMLHLSDIEESLNNMLRRKGDNKTWERNERVRRHLVNADGTINKDVVFLVCTTTLTETGRDHDYDWCILEPRSVRGEVQAIGRVRRHRPDPWDPVNVLFMERSLRSFDNPDRPWGFPGIETLSTTITKNKPVFKVHGDLTFNWKGVESILRDDLEISHQTGGSNVPILSARQGLPFAQWETQGFNARPCLSMPLSYEDTPIGAMEMAEQFAFLKASKEQNVNVGLPTSALTYREAPWDHAWSGTHAHATRFREQQRNSDGTIDMLILNGFSGSMGESNPKIRVLKNDRTIQDDVPVSSWYDEDLTTMLNDDPKLANRVFWRWSSQVGAQWSMEKHIEHLRDLYGSLVPKLPKKNRNNQEEVASMLLQSIQLPPRQEDAPQGKNAEHQYQFHPLIGFWKKA